MQPANDTTVLGNFDNVSVAFDGIKTHFYKEDGQFFVETDDSPFGTQIHRIKYTFGIRPLQQYLVELDGGRLQTLPFCWDSRSDYEGGNRWFHIGDARLITPDSLLHWSRISQNWNLMCAECHSTNLRKNYDPADKAYSTSWSEIDVSCEACHGPASEHLIWARDSTACVQDHLSRNKGFAISLTPHSPRQWLIDSQTGNAKLERNGVSTNEIEICARCHSHRTQVSDQYDYSKPLANSHAVSLIREPLYYIDGQMREEVYVYGSFLQSKMYASGVICSDCHNPHSLKLKAEGNALCGRCHQLSAYYSSAHHKHKTGSVQCIDCHMPQHTYMVIDKRRDHSFRVPRPDLSKELNTPHACSQCHNDKSVEWVASHFALWYSDSVRQPHFGQMLAYAEQLDPSTWSKLIDYANDSSHPAIVRATALTALKNYPVACDQATLSHWLIDTSALVRRAAVNLFDPNQTTYDPALLLPLLSDSIRTVRTNVARVLISNTKVQMTQADSINYKSALDEYLREQELNSDHPSGRLNLADYYIAQGKLAIAEDEIRAAIEQAPLYAASYVNLADLYRLQNGDSSSVDLLMRAVEKLPDDAGLHFALGLALVRIGRRGDAVSHLEQALELNPANSRFAYVLAVALLDSERTAEAHRVIENALDNNPNSLELLQAATRIAHIVGDQDRVDRYQRQIDLIQHEYRTQTK